MKKILNLATRLAVAAGASLALMSAQADTWPSRPIKLILGVPPGGLHDVTARLLSTELTAKLGQPVVVENRPGANTTIGANAVVQAAPDGYTYFFGGAMSGSPIFVKNNAVDAPTQLKPVSLVLSAPFFLIVNSKVPAKTLPELVAYAKQHPGKLNFGDGAPLTSMLMYAISNRAGLTYTAIPYKGSAPSLVALISGEVDVVLDTVPNYLQHIQAGTVRPLINTSDARSPVLPDVPSMADVKDIDVQSSSVVSMWAPKATPDAIINKMSSVIADIAKSPEFRAKVRTATTTDPVGSTPAELLKSFQADKALYSQVAKKIGFEPQ